MKIKDKLIGIYISLITIYDQVHPQTFYFNNKMSKLDILLLINDYNRM